MSEELENAIRHMKTRCDADMVKAITDALKVAPCDDAISRDGAIADIYDKFMTVDGGLHNETAKECIKIIQNEPNVRPIEKFSREYHKIYMEGWNEGRRKLLQAMEKEVAT